MRILQDSENGAVIKLTNEHEREVYERAFGGGNPDVSISAASDAFDAWNELLFRETGLCDDEVYFTFMDDEDAPDESATISCSIPF